MVVDVYIKSSYGSSHIGIKTVPCSIEAKYKSTRGMIVRDDIVLNAIRRRVRDLAVHDIDGTPSGKEKDSDEGCPIAGKLKRPANKLRRTRY